MFALLCAGALAADPTATMVWNRGQGVLRAVAPAGWHFAPDAPGSLEITALDGQWRVHHAGLGDPSASHVPIPDDPFQVAVDLSICADGGTACRPVRLTGAGAPARRGSLTLSVPAPPPAPVGRGAVVRLYDFGAVWCPPCNLLTTEVLHNPEHAADVAGLDLQAIDVDLPTSWALKSRYAVGGYPTLVAVDATGGEIARLVGYPGEAPTVAWLAGLAGAIPLPVLEARDPTLTGAAASSAARRLVEADRPDAARFYFAQAADDVDLHVARLALDGTRADAEWLLAHAPPGEWILPALDAAPDRWPAVVPMLAALDPVVAADVVDVIGATVGGDEGKALTASAVVMLKSAMTGEPAHDKAHVGYLADLYVRIGRTPDALALLDQYVALFPSEFTYDNAAARILLDAARYPEAEARGRRALEKGWGDQKLRAVQPLARAIAKQGRPVEAVALIDQVLANADKPDATLAVRTHRYVAQLADLRADLSSKP